MMLCLGMSLGGISSLQAEEIYIDNLKNSQVDKLPKGWKTYPFHKNKARKVYHVKTNEGHKFIQAIDEDDISVPIFKDFYWDIAKYPYLKFRWRAQKLPKGAREVHPSTNDSACGVYVGFSRTHAMKYVYSTSLPPGSYWAKNPAKFYIISRNAGPGTAGVWRDVVIDVPKDYQRFFKKKPSDPEGIGIMTDGNAVHQPAACDYADFRISSTP